MTPEHQIVKIESVKVWVTRLPSLSHPPLSMWRHRVTRLPPKNASAPWGGPSSGWLTIIIWQVSYIQYLLACQKSQRSTPYNIVKNGLPWKRVFRRRHLGRRVTAVTCLRWLTVIMLYLILCHSSALKYHRLLKVTPKEVKNTVWWRNNGHNSISNHCLRIVYSTIYSDADERKPSKLRVTGLCAGNSPGTGEFPAQMACNAENVSIWWRHHDPHILQSMPWLLMTWWYQEPGY